MNKWLVIFLFLTSSFYHLTSVQQVLAVEPFPPFSIEGNPTRDEYFDLFDLFRLVKAPFFKVYENRDRSREYEPMMICTKEGSDRRDYYCERDNQSGELVDTCDGGEVDICYRKVAVAGQFAYTTTSGSGSCTANKDPTKSGSTVGTCEYRKQPKIGSDIKATDFSNEGREGGVLPDTPAEDAGSSTPASPTSTLAYPKLQGAQNIYVFEGYDNALTWGTMYLASSTCDIATRQLLVLMRARTTKATRSSTGEWPLGWVDWGYVTKNGKTLEEIEQGLPGSLRGAGLVIMEGYDDFFLNAGNLDAVSDVGPSKKKVCEIVNEALSNPTPPAWLTDLAQTPMYSPSFRQGYVHGSICVWDRCCPGENCPLPDELLIGNSNALYGDISISQTFGAALDDLLITYPLEQASKVFNKLSQSNPLIRFAGSAAENATPKKIMARMVPELEASNPCFKYHFGGFSSFTYVYDYLETPSFLGGDKNCPGYKLQPDLAKEKAAAFPSDNVLQVLINLIWGGKTVDDVEPVKYHLLTVPDAMGQSISEIQSPVYDTRDTLRDLEAVKDYNLGLSNIVDDNAEFLYAGKSLEPGYAKRRLAYFTCNDPYFSAQTETGIEAYVFGTRIGCDSTELSPGVCDGQAFAKLIANNKGVPTTILPKATDFFNTFVKDRLTPELMKTYALAEQETGVPCEVLAGIHYVEADNNPEGSLTSGRQIGTSEPDAGGKVFNSLQQTAIYAGEELLGKAGGSINDVPTLITALSRYNGGGNSNCQQGYPYPIPYGSCPRLFEGEDDPYPVNWLGSRQNTMYLLFCADRTQCAPQVWERMGAYTVALAVYENMTKNGNSDFTEAEPFDDPVTPPPGGNQLPNFFPENCGPQTLNTALGCIPYDERFAGALLGFLAGISGGVALVIMLMGVFQMMTSAGDPQKLQKGKELFTSAIVGLLVIIFSVTLLNVIAGDIIQLPGF